MAIEVAIKKKIGNFTLDVAFAQRRRFLPFSALPAAGKSMTLKCIAGIETPDEGRIILNGRTLFDSKKKLIWRLRSAESDICFRITPCSPI